MNKETSSSPLQRGLSDEWMDHPWVEWLSANKQILLWGLVGLFAVLILSYRIIAAKTLSAENDYFKAQNAFTQLQQPDQDKAVRESSLKELKEIMAKHPELQAKYDGALAQLMLIEGQISEAKDFAQTTFKRIRPDKLFLYEDYAKTSLVVGEGLYIHALQQALQLQKKLDNEAGQSEYDPLLYSFNLLRLATLYQHLGHEQEELAAWDAMMKKTGNNIIPLIAVQEVFKTGQASLEQYIEKRMLTLSPKL